MGASRREQRSKHRWYICCDPNHWNEIGHRSVSSHGDTSEHESVVRTQTD
ncbi:hypothetical protein HSB1_15480 [Halogranum salarium B-1]|uniref:Uncharacterized protein n=1 Tax=Halogranum salarium B-1 TaxID=1210908 RepID=J2ZJP6_9EURY|nr:hypothetical protein HSB1_15480 [Halogranum salarium B-1]